MSTRNIVPRSDGEGGIGTSIKNWLKGWFKSLFVSGNITDGTDNITVTEVRSHLDNASAHDASDIDTDTTNFDNNLSPADDTVQKALDTIDNAIDLGGDMKKSTYDVNNDGIVDKSETLNDDSSGGGNNVTASEARSHIDDTNNPHNVDKTDVGLGNVPNLNTTDAVNNEHAHSNKTELDLVSDGDHDIRTDNPHGVDKTDVGLSNVPNLDTTDAVNNEHTQNSDTKLDNGQPNEVTSADLRSHLDNTNDPHDVQANQVETNTTNFDNVLSSADDTVQKALETIDDAGHGDMEKIVYDIDDNGIVDKAEVLNDGSSGGGNEVTASEARSHIDDTDNPHSTSLSNLISKDHADLTNKNTEIDIKHVTDNQKDALDNANSPSSSNPIITQDDYDSDGDGIPDQAENLNDGSSGGGNNSTASEVRTHLDSEHDSAFDFNFAFGDEKGSGIKVKADAGGTYLVVRSFIFRGTDLYGRSPTAIKVLANVLVALNPLKIKIYDSTNALTIVEKTGINNLTSTLIDLGTLSNLPTSEAIFEIQVQITNLVKGEDGFLHFLNIQF